MDRNHHRLLERALSGSNFGFTLTDNQLLIRYGDIEYGFAFVGSRDHSIPRCDSCGANLQISQGDIYYGQMEIKVRENVVASQPVELCYDCAVPK